MNLISKARGRAPQKSQLDTIQELKNHKLASDLSKQITRRWKEGDIYAPHDLSSAEMGKWRRRKQPEIDVLDVLDMNPIEEYKARSTLLLCPFAKLVELSNANIRASVLYF